MLAVYRKLDRTEASASSSENKDSSKDSHADSAIKLAEVSDLSDVSIWKRSLFKENLVFGCRTVVSLTSNGARQSVNMQKVPFVAHTYVRVDGLAGVVITDEEYPDRVAYTLLHNILREFDTKCKGAWVNQKSDANIEPKFMIDELARFQDPTSDALHRVQHQLDEVKDIMHKNIDQILANQGELEDLARKSRDLSATSREFYSKSNELNSCCRF